jgi:hypothetical protein
MNVAAFHSGVDKLHPFGICGMDILLCLAVLELAFPYFLDSRARMSYEARGENEDSNQQYRYHNSHRIPPRVCPPDVDSSGSATHHWFVVEIESP